MTRNFPRLHHPIIQAPMAGGPSTPALAAAVSAVGGLGFLAAGYKSPDELRADITRTRELTSAPVGVNLFVLAETPVDRARLTAYAQAIEPEAHRHRVAVGEPHFDDDSLDAKLEVVCRERPPITSFTFGCPAPEVVQRLHERDIAVWVTVTEVDEALLAAQLRGRRADRAGSGGRWAPWLIRGRRRLAARSGSFRCCGSSRGPASFR